MQILHLKKTQKLNTKTAIKKGKVDRVIEYSPDDLDHKFRERYHDILSQKKGGGYYLWKPYIIKQTLQQLKTDDFMIYTDSGGFYYSHNVNPLILKMKKRIVGFYIRNNIGLKKNIQKEIVSY